jgi:choline-sulfatase
MYLAFALFAMLASSGLAIEAKPNILLLITDDQSYDAVHALGWDELATPNLDRLAIEGTTFTHAYNQGSWDGAVCVASRTMLFTGKSLWRARSDEPHLQERYVATGSSWPQRIRAAGYVTGMTGKWHIKADPTAVFDEVRHVRPGMPDEVADIYNRPREGERNLFDPADKNAGGYWSGGRHWSEVVADDAIEMLQASSRDRRPFFLYAAFNAPHDPRQSPAEYVAMYSADRMSIPQSYQPRCPFAEAMGAGPELRDEKLAPFPRTPYAVRTHRAEYAAIITHLDAQIGRILNAVDSLELRDTTRIIFTSDHGLAVGRHGLMGKQNLYDHSVRVPLVLSGPGLPKGERIDHRVYMQDIFPTVLSWVGATRGDTDFHDLTPLLEKQSVQRDDEVYGAYLDRQRMITCGEWKLIVYPTIRRLCLYNLADDPDELVDLGDKAENEIVVRHLLGQLRARQVKLDDPLELPESFVLANGRLSTEN